VISTAKAVANGRFHALTRALVTPTELNMLHTP
jgi:hypothetical protein